MRTGQFRARDCAWLLGVAVATAHASNLDGYEFCEAAGPGTQAYVTRVFDAADTDPQAPFERYLETRHRLDGVHARCFTLGSERDARQFRTQRIELLHWDGWQHVIATAWVPGNGPPVAGADRP